MRIVLINSSVKESRSYGVPDGFPKGLEMVIRPLQPLGVLSVAAALQTEGFNEILVIDPDVEHLSLSDVVSKAKSYCPDVIGISTMSFTYLYSLGLARELKREIGCWIVAGGTHPTFYPREVLTHEAFDIVVTADGEYPFCGIARSLDASTTREEFLYRLHRVPGIAFREKGHVVQTAQRQVFFDLDKLPFPAYHLVNIKNYDQDYLLNPVATIITSRGCPLRCSYCSRTAWDMTDRHHSVRYVADMIDSIVRNTGANSFYFVDDTFTLHKQHAMKICEHIRERHPGIQFTALTRVTHIDRDLIGAMVKAGLQSLSLGVESGDPFILSRLCKGQSPDQIRKAFSICREFNVDTVAYFLLGHPDEKKEHIENTITLIKEIRPDWFKANILTPYPGTKIYNDLLAEGTVEDFWRRMTIEGRPFQPPNISRHLSIGELDAFRTRINIMPYTRLRDNNILKLTKIRNLENAAVSARWVLQCGFESLKRYRGTL